MRPGCPHQEERDRAGEKIAIGDPCPVCGYRYGAAWRYEAPPLHVLDFLREIMGQAALSQDTYEIEREEA
jgi:hypothetical protein